MATYRTIIDKISDIVDDPDWGDEEILEEINRGIMQIAAGGDRGYGVTKLAPLPELISIATVDTDADASVAMPATYHRNLFLVANSSGVEVKLNSSFHKLLRRYPGLSQSGNVDECAVKGKTLYYQPIPASAETLTLHFYRLPVLATYSQIETATPDGIPDHLHVSLLSNFALMEIFKTIEDGMEEAGQPNTSLYTRRYKDSLQELYDFIGPPDGVPDTWDDDSDYIGYHFYDD